MNDIKDAMRRGLGAAVILFVTLPLLAISIPAGLFPPLYRLFDRAIGTSVSLADRIVKA